MTTPAKIQAPLGRLLRDESGNIGPILAIALVPLIGGIALASETGGWFTSNRTMQHAADSAAVAAANNNSATFQDEARAVAVQYGFQNSGQTTVNAWDNVTCPDGEANCYRVTITRNVPMYLSQIVGYQGDLTIASQRYKTISATALANLGASYGYCMIGLANYGGGDAIRFDGAKQAEALKNCDVVANAGMACNGSETWGVSHFVATGTIKNCGGPTKDVTLSSPLADPYEGRKADIPTKACTSTALNGSTSFPADNVLVPCASGGVVKLTGDMNVSGGAEGKLLVIPDGANLDLNGFNLTGSGLTVIFTGPAGTSNAPGFIVDSQNKTLTVNISAPSTVGANGNWSGVAIYQDPRMQKPTSQEYNGGKNKNISWSVTGLVYAPWMDLTVQGSINKSTYSCMVLVTNSTLISGTAEILGGPKGPTSECMEAGLIVPGLTSGRATLVG